MKNNLSQRNAAIIAGLSIIIMAIAAGYSVGYVNGSLIIPNDTPATAENIKTSESLFISGIFGWVIIFICDILAAWGLYIFMKRVDKNQSLITGWLRIIYTAFLGMAIYQLILILPQINSGDSAEHILHLNNRFTEIWSNGLIVFGAHLLGLGYLAFRSGYVPKIWGILLLIAGLGYLILHGGNYLISNFNNYKPTLEIIFMLPMIAGELGLGIWLIVKGDKVNS